MKGLDRDDYREQLLKRSTSILEHTKLKYKEYQSARLMLLAFTQDKSPDYELWEHLIQVFEKIIELEESLKIKEEDKKTKVIDELGRVVIPFEFRKKLRY